eukprot:GHVR01146914.1.p1 GENE.GHVR01146914.1~~GHVR01146914.1.p1  ORF type:complete len:122 (-),score=14.77 GHVR01146914.1:589-954(-)
MDPISQKFASAAYVQYESLHNLLSSLADKSIDALAQQETPWIRDVLERPNPEEYKKSLEGRCFFMPFISRSVSQIAESIIHEMDLTPEEKETSHNELFVKTLKDNIFSNTSLVDAWFSELK